MSKTGVLFITQDMVVGQNRQSVIFLCIQAADPRQTIADADLKPGLVQAIFKMPKGALPLLGALYTGVSFQVMRF